MTLRNEDSLIFRLLFDLEDSESPKDYLKSHGAGSVSPSGNISSHFNWYYTLEMIKQEGVAGVIYHNVKKQCFGEQMPEDIFQAMEEQYLINLRRNMLIISELKIALTLFKENRLPCIILKGIALAEHIYPSIAMRNMSDVDILVKKDDLYTIDNLLSSRGYISRDNSVSRAIHNPKGYLASLEYRKDDGSSLNLHVHWHIINTSVPATMFIENVNIDRIWEKAVPAKIADVEVLTLSPEHLIIYLCEHALRVGHSFDRLILLCDIYYALKKYETVLDWNFLLAESRHFNLDRFVFFSLSIVRHYSSINIPDEYLKRVKPKHISPGERFLLYLQFNNRRIRGSSYFIYLAMNHRFFDKLRFIFRTFFPPSQILFQRQYAKDKGRLKSYYLSRIYEVFLQTTKVFFHHHKKTLNNP